mmetsp:Transcript_1138/g.3504  ORF Transcript_1138/g.3504 Transcript_1138/m.3504 type:complete len:139 (+) Transcript_1138:63-479(+)
MSRRSETSIKERVFLHSRYSRQKDTVEHIKFITHKVMGALVEEQNKQTEEEEEKSQHRLFTISNGELDAQPVSGFRDRGSGFQVLRVPVSEKLKRNLFPMFALCSASLNGSGGRGGSVAELVGLTTAVEQETQTAQRG